MKRVAIIYGLLFGVAMGGAYASWTHEPEEAVAEGVVLIDAQPEQVSQIAYEDDEIKVAIDVKKDDRGQYLWVSTEKEVAKRKPPVADPHVPKPPEPEKTDEAPEVKKAKFKAGQAGDELLADLAPFRVTRSLDVSKDELSKFGFDEPEGKLTVTTAAGKTRTFEIGDTAYGHKNTYLRDADSGEVYVIKRSIISPLGRADTRLPEKELFDFQVADITRAVASTAGASLEFVQRNRDDVAKATWTLPNSDEANVTVDSWLDKVFRLRASSYTTKEEAGQIETVFAVKLFPDDAEPLTIEVMRGVDDKGEPTWFARSEYTRGLVQLNGNLAADAADDVQAVFADPTDAGAEPVE